MTTRGELVGVGDKSNPIDCTGNLTVDEFTDMRRTAKSVRYSSQPVCRPVSTRRDWQADTVIRSFVSEQAAIARATENENKSAPQKEKATERNENPRPVFDLSLSEIPAIPLTTAMSSLSIDRSNFRTLLITHLTAAKTNEVSVLLQNASFASIIVCLFTKLSEDEVCTGSPSLVPSSAQTESLFGEPCEEGLIRH